MDENITKIQEEAKGAISEPAVWNPNVAGLWSLLFTPVFGSVIVRKNWEYLGEFEQVRKSKIWIILSSIFYFLSLIIPILGLIFIIVWYYSSQKKQTKYIHNKFGKSYAKKGWGKPFLIGLFGLWLPYTALNFAISYCVGAN